TSVMNYPITEGKTGQQMADHLQKHLEDLGAEKSGNFSVDCDTYQYVTNPNKAVHVLHNSETPYSCYSFIDSPSGVHVVTDASFDLLIQKMKQFYIKKQPKIESKGAILTLCDFSIKIGSVVFGQMTTFKGLLIEIEYKPCNIPKEVYSLLKEFCHHVFGSEINFDETNQYFKSNSEVSQTSTDVICQYLDYFLFFKMSSLSLTQPMTGQANKN
ncbi:hypothetical protein HELRODRAFT_63878, partial [Helobdella robusta]|uniref:Mediator of RNA polymerase II transcription subunit 20 n=1 Tax=Helobdella robusta TaxID=6412 RepID=T1FXL7_HELRO